MSLSVAGQLPGPIGVGGGTRGSSSKLVKFGDGELMGKKIIPGRVRITGGLLGCIKNGTNKHRPVRMSLTADFTADSKVIHPICFSLVMTNFIHTQE